MDIQEDVLYTEVTNQRKKKFEQLIQRESFEIREKETPRLPSYVSGIFCEEQEREIIAFLLNSGEQVLFHHKTDDFEEQEITISRLCINFIDNP